MFLPATFEDPTKWVYLQPLGHVSKATVEHVRQDLEKTFNVHVVLEPQMPLPKVAWYAPRKRWFAQKIIRIPTGRSEPTFYVTTQDIAIPDHGLSSWGIFGLADKNAVVSTFRMKHSNQVLHDVTIHEFGHVLGLPHCPDKNCVMEAWSGKDSFTKNSHYFCASCRARISDKLR